MLRPMMRSVVTIACLAAFGAITSRSTLADGWTININAENGVLFDSKVPSLSVREFVPANSVVVALLTSNGKIITNPDHSTAATFVYDNSQGAAGLTSTLAVPSLLGAGLAQINGMNVTDFFQTTTFIPPPSPGQSTQQGSVSGTLQAGAFNPDGTMPLLASWLSGAGYIGTPLTVPDFFSPTAGSLYFGVSLNNWAQQHFVVTAADVGSTYQIVNGTVTSEISGNGPSPSQLASFSFDTNPLSSLPGGGFGPSSDPGYTGTAQLFGWHELSAQTIPEPSSLVQMAIGCICLLCSRRLWLRFRPEAVAAEDGQG